MTAHALRTPAHEIRGTGSASGVGAQPVHQEAPDERVTQPAPVSAIRSAMRSGEYSVVWLIPTCFWNLQQRPDVPQKQQPADPKYRDGKPSPQPAKAHHPDRPDRG